MTIFFLLLGVIVGGASVTFIFQNPIAGTVSFFDWQIEGSLAVLLLIAMGSGALVAILFLLPSLITSELRLSKERRQKIKLEEELTTTKQESTITSPPEKVM